MNRMIIALFMSTLASITIISFAACYHADANRAICHAQAQTYALRRAQLECPDTWSACEKRSEILAELNTHLTECD